MRRTLTIAAVVAGLYTVAAGYVVYRTLVMVPWKQR